MHVCHVWKCGTEGGESAKGGAGLTILESYMSGISISISIIMECRNASMH
jgi:hypothetical protein